MELAFHQREFRELRFLGEKMPKFPPKWLQMLVSVLFSCRHEIPCGFGSMVQPTKDKICGNSRGIITIPGGTSKSLWLSPKRPPFEWLVNTCGFSALKPLRFEALEFSVQELWKNLWWRRNLTYHVFLLPKKIATLPFEVFNNHNTSKSSLKNAAAGALRAITLSWKPELFLNAFDKTENTVEEHVLSILSRWVHSRRCT